MEVYRSMTDPGMLNAMMGGTANMEPKEGGKFSLLAGSITGENVKLVCLTTQYNACGHLLEYNIFSAFVCYVLAGR